MRELVELHGGLVSVQSDGEGLGSAFTVNLPVVRACAEAPRAPRPRPAPAAPRSRACACSSSKTTPTRREIAAAVITDAGGEAVVARSAAEALAAVTGAPEGQAAAVIITDIGLPVTDGYALLRSLRKLPEDRGGALPIAAVTAYASEADRVQALQRGFDAHISKPFAPDTLVSAISRLSAGLSK